ncbi:MAG: DnaJ domain-containing protein [Alphaproteobacteria bacterium]|nr:DnaJ domain-containing protein [Alphaproteobacteria bacterium]
MRNLYDVLGVPKDADQATIRKTFKKLARELHPDRNPEPEAEQRFKEVSAAYSVLGDDEKRKLYDEFGEVSLRPGFDAEQARRYGAGGFPGGGFSAGGPGFSFEDLFGDLFGRGGRGGRGNWRVQPMMRGQDIHATIAVDLMTALKGGETSIRVDKPNAYGGLESTVLRVKIPAGVDDGQTIRLRDMGGPGAGGGPAGDVLLEVNVRPHPRLRRDDQDLEIDVPITLHEAMAGARIEVPTPWGRYKVNVPAGSSSGSRLRLKGKGLPSRGSTPAGDLYLALRPTPPRTEAPEAIALAEQLDAFYDGDVRAELDFLEPQEG